MKLTLRWIAGNHRSEEVEEAGDRFPKFHDS